MPWGDGSGPSGLGRMSGCMAGLCAGNRVPGFVKPGYGYGMLRMENMMTGRGMGFRTRRCFRYWDDEYPRFFKGTWADPDLAESASVSKKQFLQRQADFLQNRLSKIKQMLDDQEKKDQSS